MKFTRAGYLAIARFVELLKVGSPFKASKKKWLSFSTTIFYSSSIFALISNGPAHVELIDFQYMHSIRKRYTRT